MTSCAYTIIIITRAPASLLEKPLNQKQDILLEWPNVGYLNIVESHCSNQFEIIAFNSYVAIVITKVLPIISIIVLNSPIIILIQDSQKYN